jgi:hypothetical protein
MENVMPWLLADYHPVSFFSLRPAHATTSGGQTLLTPTAFALKMALLGAAIQTAGLAEGRQRFPVIAKIRRPIRLGNAEVRDAEIAEALGKGHYPFAPTIAYRELVQFGNPLAAPTDNLLRVAFASPAGEPPAWLGEALLAINYFGKRGGFMQLTGRPSVAADLPPDFTPITQDTTSFDLRGTLQMLDDCGPTMTFEHADIYSPKRIALGKERILRHVVLPYRLARSSRGYSLYQRLSPTDGR